MYPNFRPKNIDTLIDGRSAFEAVYWSKIRLVITDCWDSPNIQKQFQIQKSKVIFALLPMFFSFDKQVALFIAHQSVFKGTFNDYFIQFNEIQNQNIHKCCTYLNIASRELRFLFYLSIHHHLSNHHRYSFECSKYIHYFIISDR